MPRGKDKGQRTRRKQTSSELKEKKRKRAAELRHAAEEKIACEKAARTAFFDAPKTTATSCATQNTRSDEDPGKNCKSVALTPCFGVIVPLSLIFSP